MGITLDTPGGGGAPAVKFDELGAYVVVGIVKIDEVQSRDYTSGDLETWADGSAKMHKRITGLVTAVDRASVGKDGEERPVEVGELVALFTQGGRHYTYRDAVKEHGAVEVGDVMKWTFDRTEKAKNPRHADRKVYVAKLRKPESKDGDLLERCEAAYYELRDRVQLEPAGASAPAASGGQWDEEPFLSLGVGRTRDLHFEV